MATAELHLLIPGLLGPVPAQARKLPELAELPALAELFSRGEAQTAAEGLQAQLAELFGLDAEPAAGPVARYGEDVAEQQGYWFRAAPLHLRADRDRVMVFGGGMLELPADQEAALVAAFNEFFHEDGLHLEAHAHGWYLRTEQPPELQTAPLQRLLGRYLDAFLPQGRDAAEWRRLLNEVQMLFHGHAVNALREERGELIVNGLWLWGGGEALPEVAPAWDRVVGDEPYLRGLARLAGAELEPGRDEVPEFSGRVLQYLDWPLEALSAGDIGQWVGALQRLERDVIAPAMEQLRAGHWQRLVVHTDLGRSRALGRRRGVLRRLLRRRGQLADHLLTQEHDA